MHADDTGMRLDNFLLRVFKNVPKSRVYKIIRSGEVRVNKGRAKPGTRLAESDDVRIPPVRQPIKASPGRPPDALMHKVRSAIVAETADYLLFAKPAGLAVHAGSGLRFGLIEVLRAARPGEYFELVHRLDRQTSGCLLIARSRAALDDLRAGLNDAAANKRYVALVEGRWPHGAIEVDAPLSRDIERAGERVVTVDRVGGRASLSYFRPVAFYRDATRMDVAIRTGRTHQIRVHAAHCGHPVAADDKYGPNARASVWRERGLNRLALHAASVTLDFRGVRHCFNAPLADDLVAVIDRLSGVG
ncbi:RluA family pseudouridine synthase [Salinisphaera sp.]|uniref:RluA family pseudouridine synthase n=1 Tax=Salinisphaera sp. TaxID=1914330 RepID=UPI002D784FF9|nr:RluA family pseudouridine synthase [Salinisphaera sp.]HET7314716.1 RluA family pseudouridine synthase [Salinisphaera sp.]